MSEIPSAPGAEWLVCDYVRCTLRSADIEIREDAIGNLYATRAGTADGHVLVVAHLDKHLGSNRFELAGSTPFGPGPGDESLAVSPSAVRVFELREDGFTPVRTGRRASSLRLWRLSGVPAGRERGVYVLPRLRAENGLIIGKLDDAVGLALALDLLLAKRSGPSLTVSALFTVSEEAGLVGATFASRRGLIGELGPDAILVLDVTCDGQVGNGPGLYLTQGRGRPATRGDRELAESFVAIARDVGLDLDVGWRPIAKAREDSRAIARYTKYPVAAFKVSARWLHGFAEAAAWRDIELAQAILHARAGIAERRTISQDRHADRQA